MKKRVAGDKLYYHGVPKDCKNCFFYKREGLFGVFGRCNLKPGWLLADALEQCLFEMWEPNEKLYKKYRRTE